jgi:hypothetical protein
MNRCAVARIHRQLPSPFRHYGYPRKFGCHRTKRPRTIDIQPACDRTGRNVVSRRRTHCARRRRAHRPGRDRYPTMG